MKKIEPERITIEITNACNLSCKMCFLEGFRRKKIFGAKPRIFLPFETIKKIIDEISENFVSIRMTLPFSFILTGGEAFLHPDIFNILSYANGKKIGVTIFTNGTLIDEKLAQKIVECGPEALMFSLDGTKEVHDQIRGAGNFEKTYQAIKFIQKEKIGRSSVKPKIFINSLISDLSADNLEEFVSLCDGLGIDGLSLSHIQWSNSKLSRIVLEELEKRLDWNEPPSKMVEGMEHALCVSDNKIIKLLNQIEKIKTYKNNHRFQIKFNPDVSSLEIKRWYASDAYRIDSCDRWREWIRIGANGEVLPVCAAIPFPWGNLKEQSLGDALNGDKARKFAQEIEDDGLFYACQRCCRRPAKSFSLKNK